MSLTEDQSNGPVHIYFVKKNWMPFWFWYLIYDDVFLLFDKVGVSFTLKSATKRCTKAVQRIIRYENKEKTR